MTLTATADDILIIYNEGLPVGFSIDWRDPISVILNDPCVIALEGG